MGNWKGIRTKIFEGNMELELYDLQVDPSEQNNVAEAHPDIIAKIEDIMREEHTVAEIDRFKMKELGDMAEGN